MKSTLCLLMALLCNVAWAQTSTDGPIVTFTNVQQDGTTYTLYIDGNNVLATSAESVETLGDAAKFRATLQADGTYTFYNETKQLYMIWRGKGEGHNSDKGVLKEYNANFCNWTLASGSNSKENTYFFYAKRNNTSKYGTLVLMKSDGAFDGWGETAAWAGNYSNLYSISGDAYTATLTDTKGVVHECTAKGLPLSGATVTNPVWKNGNLTADVALTIPVSSGNVTNRVFISPFNKYTNKYFADGTSVKANRNSDLPFPSNVDAKNYLWAFYPTLEGSTFKYRIKNIGTGTYIKSESNTNAHSGNEVSLVAEAEATLFTVTSSNQLVNSKGYRLSIGSEQASSDAIQFVGTYNTDHNGTKNKIVDANNYTLTLSDGSTFIGTNGVHNLMGGSYTYTNGTWSDNGYSAAVNVDFTSLPFPVSSAEKVNPTMISSFNEGAGGYGPGRFKWYAAKDDDGDDDVKIKRDALVTEDLIEAYSWAIYPSMENGAFAYSIKNVALGKCIQATKNFGATAGDNNEGTIILSDTPTKFSVDSNNSLYFFANERNQYLSLGSSGTTDGFLGLHTKTYADGHKGITNAFLTPRYALASKDELKSGAIYTFLTARGWVGATDSDNVIATAYTTVNPAASTENEMFQWALYQSKNGNYYLYNLGKKMFMGDVDQSVDEGDIPFAASPMNRNMAFKNNAQAANFPIMFSTNNIHAVSQNTAKGLFAWKGGWNNNDEGSNHQVSYIGELDAEQLKTIADLVEAYDRSMPMKVEVEDSWENNPNTHFGNLTVTTGSAVTTTKLTLENMEVSYVEYTGAGDIFNFTREYRGFEFQGFFLGGENLGKSLTLTEEQEANITEQNPLVAKFAATDEVTLFYDDDEFSYRIPAIATTSTGRLIAVSDYRHSLDDIGRYNFGTATPGIDLVIRTSDDNGKTWSDTTIIAKGSGVRNSDNCAYGDAAIAVVGQKVLVMGAAGDVMFGNGSATAHNRTVRIFSENNGGTWTAPQDISETFFIRADATINSAYSLFFGSGKLAVDEDYNGTGNARIYGAVLVKKNGIGNGIYVVYTDDFGLTWSILGGSQTHITANDEPKVEILPSGQILLSVRRGGGRQFNVFTYSNKATNAGSWNSNVNGCGNGGSNTCNGEIFLVDAKNALGEDVKLLLQSQPKGGSGQYDRRDVTIWYKEVDNTSYTSSQIAGNWIEGMQVSTQQSAYSTMSLQDDGKKIAFFFEEAPCYGDDQAKGYCMVYMPLTIEEITKNNYFSLDADFITERNISVVLTDAEGNEYCDQFESTLPGVATTLKGKYPFITLGDNATLESADGENFNYTNTVTLPFKVSNEENTYWHNIYWHGNNTDELVYLYGGSADAEYVAKVAPGSNIPYGNSDYNTAAKSANMSWAVYHAGNFTFTLKNMLTDKYIKVTGVATINNNGGKVQNTEFVEEGATAFEIVTETGGQNYKGDYSFKATVNDAAGYLCNTSASYGWTTHYDGNGHEGGWATIVEAPDFEILFGEVNAAVEAVSDIYGARLGQYHLADDLKLETIRTAMENPNELKLNVLLDYKEKLNAPQLNMPKAGQFFRIKAVDEWNDDAPYLGAQNSTASTSRTEFVANADESTVFYYDGSQLVSYKSGYYLRNNSSFLGYAGVQTSGTTFGFDEASNGLKGAYNISFNNGGRWLYCNKANYTDAGGRGTENGYCFNLEEVTELPFTISSVGYGTLWAPVALEIPDHVKAYTGVLNADGNVLELTKITTGIIPDSTGVVIYRDGESYDEAPTIATTHNFAITSTAETLKSDFSGSVATIASNTIPNPYTLQTHEGDVAFKKFTGTSITGFKAYLQFKSAQQAQALRIRFATTEIETPMANGQQPTAIYDLQGRRVENPTKGIYIVDGKKVIVK